MQISAANGRPPRATGLLVAVALTVLPLAGCACDETDWITTVAEAAPLDAAPDCEFDALDRPSKAAAALAERADPRLIEIARLEAERDCYKAAAIRARQRNETNPRAPQARQDAERS